MVSVVDGELKVTRNINSIPVTLTSTLKENTTVEQFSKIINNLINIEDEIYLSFADRLRLD